MNWQGEIERLLALPADQARNQTLPTLRQVASHFERFSRGAPKECSPAAERRKNVATAEGRGWTLASGMSRGAAKDSFAAPRLMPPITQIHGLQPWLHSYAAPRLGTLLCRSAVSKGRKC